MMTGRETKDAKETRDKLINDILDRQIKAEKGEITPLCIYPEGSTTNGKTILQFKRGAFMALRPVRPYYTKTWTLTGISACHGDATSLLGYINLLIHCMFTIYTITELPIFRPNDFFWKNHWDGKE